MIRPVTVMLLTLLVLVQHQLWFSNGGVLKTLHLYSNVQRQRQVNKQLVERNVQITKDIINLKQGNSLIEERARHDLGMVKSGEVFYEYAN